jgi:hypothetical protein
LARESSFQKERTKCTPLKRALLECQLDGSEVLLERADGPAALGLEVKQVTPRLVHRTDVPHFIKFAVFPLFNPTERQSLGSAHVRPAVINPTFSILVKERTRSLRMRPLLGQKYRIAPTDVFGLHLEDRQFIDAASAATGPATETRPATPGYQVCLGIHLLIEPVETIHRHPQK